MAEDNIYVDLEEIVHGLYYFVSVQGLVAGCGNERSSSVTRG
jgi:hypothetical protein